MLVEWGMVEAQTSEERPIAELVGGHVRTSMAMAGSGRLWGFMPDAADWTSGGPAELALSEKRTLTLGWVPGFSQNLQKWFDVNGTVREKMDNLMRDYGAADSRLFYPSLSSAAGFESSPADLALAVPFKISGRRFGAGFAFGVPLSAAVSLTATGIEAGIDTEQNIQGERKRLFMRTSSSISAALNLRMSRIWFGLGADLGRGITIGAAAGRARVSVESRVRAGVDGIVSISGIEYVYNDPTDPRIDFKAGEQNAINQSFDADFSGSGWHFRFGLDKTISRSWRVHLAADLPPALRLAGSDSLVNNRIPYIRIEDGHAGGVDDMIDPAKIDLARLTKTERVVKVNRYAPVLSLPRSFGMGAEWEKGKIRIAFGYALYSGEASISADGKTMGMKLKHGAHLLADLGWFFLGGEADLGKTMSDEEGGGGTVVFPRVQFGFRAPIASAFSMEGRFGIEPVPNFAVRGIYKF
jgi:hypothetical protein